MYLLGNDLITVRQAAARAIKRVKHHKDSSDSDSEGGSCSDSDFKLSASDSDQPDSQSEESNVSSDFNPFDDDSDSEGNKRISMFINRI